jgi:hypothetical protein
MQTIGKCSLCGGAVMVCTGPYFGQPPPPSCSSCHAVRDEAPDVIPMKRREDHLGLDNQRAQLLAQSGNVCMSPGQNTSLASRESQPASPDDVARWIVEGGFL